MLTTSLLAERFQNFGGSSDQISLSNRPCSFRQLRHRHHTHTFSDPTPHTDQTGRNTGKMGGLNLEVFKFGMYIMFPIGIMYYFGTNLDSRFSVPEFWPKPENANRIPLERDEIEAELQRLRARRLYLREKRLGEQGGQQQPRDQQE
ncbi:hypothetical protein QC762_707400 [Podospora pseudocomata]|nr:hypothetical protein QC762_707400 [Podospora pseudocomata]